MIFYINIWDVWSWGVLGVINPPGMGANFLGLILSNFVMHAVDSIQHGFAYNPGLLGAWVVFVPFCHFAYVTLLKSDRLTTARVVQSILAGFGGHAIFARVVDVGSQGARQ